VAEGHSRRTAALDVDRLTEAPQKAGDDQEHQGGAPITGDPSVSARSAALGDTLGVGSVRHYQAYYRDPVLGFCSGPGFSASSGLTFVWQ